MLYRLLLGATRQNELAMNVRASCVDADVARLPALIEQWRSASQRMRELAAIDPFVGGVPRDIPTEHASLIATIEAAALFAAAFSHVPSRCQLVNIDSLVAPQRDVNL